MTVRSAAQRAHASRWRQQQWAEQQAQEQPVATPPGSWWTEPDFAAAHRRELPRITAPPTNRAVYRTHEEG